MILITGATGLVGAHLAQQLLQNKEKIVAIYRNQKSLLKTKTFFENHSQIHLFNTIIWIQADITNIPSLEIVFNHPDFTITHVYHCAAMISFLEKDENQLRKTNIEGTANIVNFCLYHSISKLCYVSSIAALGDLAVNQTIIDENCDWNPEKNHSNYAISKYGAEMEVWRGQQEGLDMVIVNPAVILGNFDGQGSSGIVAKIKKGMWFYTNGSTGFVGIEDVVKAMIILMKSNIIGERFCLVAESYTYKIWVDLMCNNLNIPSPKYRATPLMTSIAATLSWLLSKITNKKPILTKEIAAALHEKNSYSNKKIIESIDFEFQTITVICSKWIF